MGIGREGKRLAERPVAERQMKTVCDQNDLVRAK